MTMCSAVSCSPVDKEIRPSPANLPRARMTSTSFFASSVSMPLTNVPTTCPFHAAKFLRSIFGGEKVIPMCAASAVCDSSLVAENSALVGMHPTLRHVPPSALSSIKATLNPNWAARIAQTYPPGPPPMMPMSVFIMIVHTVAGESKWRNRSLSFAQWCCSRRMDTLET